MINYRMQQAVHIKNYFTIRSILAISQPHALFVSMRGEKSEFSDLSDIIHSI